MRFKYTYQTVMTVLLLTALAGSEYVKGFGHLGTEISEHR